MEVPRSQDYNFQETVILCKCGKLMIRDYRSLSMATSYRCSCGEVRIFGAEEAFTFLKMVTIPRPMQEEQQNLENKT